MIYFAKAHIILWCESLPISTENIYCRTKISINFPGESESLDIGGYDGDNDVTNAVAKEMFHVVEFRRSRGDSDSRSAFLRNSLHFHFSIISFNLQFNPNHSVNASIAIP